jgi:hypothetical protein
MVCGYCGALSAIVPERIICQGIERTWRDTAFHRTGMEFPIDILNYTFNYRFSTIRSRSMLLEMVTGNTSCSGRRSPRMFFLFNLRSLIQVFPAYSVSWWHNHLRDSFACFHCCFAFFTLRRIGLELRKSCLGITHLR